MHSITAITLLALNTAVQGLPQTLSSRSADVVCFLPILNATNAYIYASTSKTAVTGLQLTNSAGNAVLQATGFDGLTSFENSQISVYDSTSSCEPDNLEVGTAVSGVASLTWSVDANTGPAWVASSGQTIEVKIGGTTTPAQFLACGGASSGVWALSLQETTGGAPVGCVKTELAVAASS